MAKRSLAPASPPMPAAPGPRPRPDDLDQAGGLRADHEQSETQQRPDGRWINVYGKATPKAGQPLPRMFPWERESYDTAEEAVRDADRRSKETDPATHRPRQPGPGSSAPGRTLASAGDPTLGRTGHVMAPAAPEQPGVMPLADYLMRVAAPRGTIDEGPRVAEREAMIREGARALIERFRQEGGGLPASARPYLPNTLSDAQPVHQQIETAPEEYPETFYDTMAQPRPGEATTPRELQILDEIRRGEGVRRSLAVEGQA